MIGIYVIADADGRVYYVGKSKHIEKRAKQHLYEMSRDESDWRKNKMYWLLGRMYYTQPIDLGLYVAGECEEAWLDFHEQRIMKQLQPVLNSIVPPGCRRVIQEIDTVTDAIVYADQNTKWDFGHLKRLW